MGSLILHLFRERTGLIERRIERRNARTKKVLRATEEVLNYLSDRHARAELMSPQYLPMLVKPRPWTGMFEGGYLTPGRQLCMVRGKGVNRNAIEEIQNRFDDFPMLLQALNAVQETPWQVNRDVYSVLLEAWEIDGEIGGLPRWDDYPLPPRVVPRDLKRQDMTEDQQVRFKTWMMHATGVQPQQPPDVQASSNCQGARCRREVS